MREEIINSLLTVAVDAKESDDLRERAVSALAEYDDEKSRKTIKSWLLSAEASSAGDDLRGEALQQLWPKYLTAAELFSILTAPEKEHHVGIYQLFLNTLVVPGLSPADLTLALAWCEKHAGILRTSFVIQRLVDEIFLAAWPHLLLPRVASAFARGAILRLKENHSFISGAGFSGKSEELQRLFDAEQDRRRALCLALLQLLEPREDGAILLSISRVARTDDFEWLLGLLPQAEPDLQNKIAILAGAVFNVMDPHQFDLAFKSAERYQLLAEQLQGYWRAIDIDSERARTLREHCQRQREFRNRTAGGKPPTQSRTIEEQVSAQLDSFDAGNFDAWWGVVQLLQTNPQERVRLIHNNLKAAPVWEQLNETTQRRILAAARVYLEKGDPHTDEWFGKDRIFYSMVAGYSALFLLKSESQVDFEGLSVSVWQRWAASILCSPSVTDKEENIQRAIGANAYAKAPEAVVDAALGLIKAEKNTKSGRLSMILDILRDCSPDILWPHLLDMLKTPAIQPADFEAILTTLLRNKFAAAREYAIDLINGPLSADPTARKKSIAAGQALLQCSGADAWPALWKMMQSDADFGKAIFLRACQHGVLDQPAMVTDLNEDQLGDLFIWLETHFPRSSDPSQDGKATFMGPRDSIVHLRDGILHRLKVMGSDAACGAIEKIRTVFPELDWLRVLLIDARENARRAAWVPPTPEELLALTRNTEARLVRDADELLSAVVRSIGRLQSLLVKGEPPRARALWDEFADRPKDESALSDFAKSFLDDDLTARGIFPGREVQVYGGKRGRGASTDIHIDAVATKSNRNLGRVKVIVEVKGCWNPRLHKDMREQLVDDYLAHSDCNHGIYLVGWFGPSGWNGRKDPRRKQVRFASKKDLQVFLNEEAKALSCDSVRIAGIALDCNIPARPSPKLKSRRKRQKPRRLARKVRAKPGPKRKRKS